MATKRHNGLTTFSFIALFLLLIGIALSLVYLIMFRGKTDNLSVTIMWGAVGTIAVGFIFTLIGILAFRIADMRDRKLNGDADSAKREVANQQAATQGSSQRYVVDGPEVTYIPSIEAYDFVIIGKRQPIEEKFAEISKMDKTQFVIYVARLFSRKGYQVKLTPVLDNHDIDMLVEKMGVTIAVGCILTNKVLCKEDIISVKNGRSYYGVSNSMALTNMYFDRTALDFAKSEYMSLVDRNVLAQDFML
ncbi:MAG: restriction endonuclease [Clostridiales bacterium]|nr:restriction endonuclease [Clostridiales bacterium]